MLLKLADEEKKCWGAWLSHFKAFCIEINARERTHAFFCAKKLEYPKNHYPNY